MTSQGVERAAQRKPTCVLLGAWASVRGRARAGGRDAEEKRRVAPSFGGRARKGAYGGTLCRVSQQYYNIVNTASSQQGDLFPLKKSLDPLLPLTWRFLDFAGAILLPPYWEDGTTHHCKCHYTIPEVRWPQTFRSKNLRNPLHHPPQDGAPREGVAVGGFWEDTVSQI